MSVVWKIVCTDGKKDAVPLSVGKTVIGRGHLLQIRELKVSRHHAEVQVTESGELVLKAMHPGLPCFYKKGNEESRTELLRGATVSLEEDDVFSLHSNPECEFKVLKTSADKPVDAAKDDKHNSEDGGEEEDNAGSEEEVSNEEDGSDWSGSKKSSPKKPAKRKPPVRKAVSEEDSESEEKPKARTGRTKKKPVKKTKSSSSRRPPPKKRKPASSEEEISQESEASDSDSGGRRSRRQPARMPQRLPARRAAKPVSYNEDLMLEGMSPSEPEEESDHGLPRIGRQKKPDSDSDFKVDEDSGSDWDEGRSKRSRRGAPPPKITPSRSKGRRRKNSDTSDEEPEYIPQATRRRRMAAPKKRSKCKFGGECYRKNKDHKEEFIHPGDSDWSDSSHEEDSGEQEQSDKGSGNGSDKGSGNGSDKGSDDGSE